MSKPLYPVTLTREQFINSLEQFLNWLEDEMEGEPLETASSDLATLWVDHMDSIQPCWPDEEER